MNQTLLQKQYIKDQVLNATPEHLIVMLLDGAIRSVDASKKCINDKDPFKYNELLIKAQRIVAELMGALKSEVYPEMVANMSRLYEYIYHILVEGNLHKDVSQLDQATKLLKGMRDTWASAIEKSAVEGGDSAESVTSADQTNRSALPKEKAHQSTEKKPSFNFEA